MLPIRDNLKKQIKKINRYNRQIAKFLKKKGEIHLIKDINKIVETRFVSSDDNEQVFSKIIHFLLLLQSKNR